MAFGGEFSLNVCLNRKFHSKFLLHHIHVKNWYQNVTLGNVTFTYGEFRNEISNNVVCATSKGSDQPVHTRSQIRAFASRLNIL